MFGSDIFDSNGSLFFNDGSFARNSKTRDAVRQEGTCFYNSSGRMTGFRSGNFIKGSDGSTKIQISGNQFYANGKTYFKNGNELRSSAGKTWWNVGNEDAAVECILMDR